jgi:hypothetical protein
LGGDPLDLLLHHRARAPVELAAANPLEEVLKHLLAVGRVDHLRVKLDPVDAALHGLECRHRGSRGGRQRLESGRRRKHGVAVRHPARLLPRRAVEQPPGLGHGQLRAPELPHLGAFDASSQLARQKLHAVTDAEHGNAELEQLVLERRRAIGVHRRRPAREDHSLRPPSSDLLRADVVGQKL